MIEFEQPANDADIMSEEEWEGYVSYGVFTPSDGSGYWGTETHFSRKYDCFSKKPKGATHVHWYNE